MRFGKGLERDFGVLVLVWGNFFAKVIISKQYERPIKRKQSAKASV